MKKKTVALMLAAAMAASLTACAGSGSSAESKTTAAADSSAKEESTKADDAEKTTDAAEKKDNSDLKIGLVTDVGGVNDGSFNQSSWEGLQKAAEDFGVEVNYLDYDLIISVGYMLADATRWAAEANPDCNFAIIDDATIDLPNVTCLMFRQEQAAYLVGYVAGLMTKTNNIGFVIGMTNETMNLFGYGYCAGAIDANPDITIQQFNANSFADPATGKTNASTAITNGADIIFHAAGATGLGVIEACQEAGVYAIGVDRDQYNDAPGTVVTSAMKRVDNAVYDSVESLINGTLKGGVHTYDLAAGGVDIAPSQDLLPEDVKKAVEDVKKKIVAGEVTVPSSKEEFEAAYGDVYQLD